MSLPSLSFLLELPGLALSFMYGKLFTVFLSPGGSFSLASLFSALCVAILFLGFKRQRRKQPLRFKVLLRALFPRRLLSSPSTRADVGFLLFNVFLAGMLFGWAILSYQLVSTAAHDGLAATFGAIAPTSLSDFHAACILTLALFLAYELGYWLDHYLSHNIPLLWEFHKVHHTAEVLSPLTTFRVHPVDTLVFYNILALIMGGTGGLVHYTLGTDVPAFAIGNKNVIILAFMYLVGHLHHSHFWIAFPGRLGRLILSPAHHQLHHSTNPIHFNKNLGGSLAIWDWMFGTLHVPTSKREKLEFGVEPKRGNPHTAWEALVAPIGRALGHIKLPLPPRGAGLLTRPEREPPPTPHPATGRGLSG